MPIDKTYIDRIARRFDGLAGSFRLGSKTLTSDIDAYLWFCANLEEETKNWVPFVNKNSTTNEKPKSLSLSSNMKAFLKRVGMYDQIIKEPDYKDVVIQKIFNEFNTDIIKRLLEEGLIFVKTDNNFSLYSTLEDELDTFGVQILAEGKENALLDISSFKPTELEEFSSYLLDIKGKQIILNELGSREYVCQTVPDFIMSNILYKFDLKYEKYKSFNRRSTEEDFDPFRKMRDFLMCLGENAVNNTQYAIDILKNPQFVLKSENDLIAIMDCVNTKHEIIQQVLKVYHLTDSVSSAVDAYIGFVMPEESNVVVPEISF